MMNEWARRRARVWARVEMGSYEANKVPHAANGASDNGAKLNGENGSGPKHADTPTENLFRRARDLERAGDLGAAHDLYQRVLLEDPGNLRARNNLGCLYDAQGRYTLALDQFEAAHALAPENLDVILNLGDALVALSRYDEGEREYRNAQRLDPARADSYVHLGALFFKRGLYAQSDEELKKAIELGPE